MKEPWSSLEEAETPTDWRNRNDLLNIADILENATSEGPGIRFTIWVQGCPIRCKGCWNSHTWDFVPRHIVSVKKLTDHILSKKEEIDGITLVGGEPLAQATAVRKLIENVEEEGLTVMLYTGYEEDQITGKDAKEAFAMADIVVAGPYVKEKRNLFLRWRGSENQRLVFHNKEYEDMYGEEERENVVEIHIDEKNGEMVIVGFPDEEIEKEVEKW